MMEWNSKEILLKELEDEYLKQFPNSERPSNSLFDIGSNSPNSSPIPRKTSLL